MRYKYIILSFLCFAPVIFSQNYPSIAQLIQDVNRDSLVSYVRILSGEDSVYINDTLTIIPHRGFGHPKYLAAEFIKHKMETYNLEVYEQPFHLYDTGRNIYAIQRGILQPEKYFIYCAHYDGANQHAADDNASGVSNVIEAARLLSRYSIDYSIIYAFWDLEEFARQGSKYFAAMADSLDMQILGVINSEMSGYDSNDDGLMDIHTRNFANSVYLAEVIYTMQSFYNISVNPVIYNPGTWASDHTSFWEKGFSAIEFCQAYYGDDYNPFYHEPEDRIDKFNLAFFHNMSKLGLAALTHLALNYPLTNISDNHETITSSSKIFTHPNPFNSEVDIHFNLAESGNISLILYNILGEQIQNLYSGLKSAGEYDIRFNGGGLSDGVYFVVLKTSETIVSHKLVHLR